MDLRLTSRRAAHASSGAQCRWCGSSLCTILAGLVHYCRWARDLAADRWCGGPCLARASGFAPGRPCWGHLPLVSAGGRALERESCEPCGRLPQRVLRDGRYAAALSGGCAWRPHVPNSFRPFPARLGWRVAQKGESYGLDSGTPAARPEDFSLLARCSSSEVQCGPLLESTDSHWICAQLSRRGGLRRDRSLRIVSAQLGVHLSTYVVGVEGASADLEVSRTHRQRRIASRFPAFSRLGRTRRWSRDARSQVVAGPLHHDTLLHFALGYLRCMRRWMAPRASGELRVDTPGRHGKNAPLSGI